MTMIPSNREKPAVTLPILIGALVALLAFIGGVGYYNFAPRPADTRKREVTQEEKQQVSEQTAWLKEKARETGGDWQKLSPEDQQRLKMVAKDQSQTILKFYAESK